MLSLMMPLKLSMLMKILHHLNGTISVPPPLLSPEWLSQDEMQAQDAKRQLSELRQGRQLYHEIHSKETQEDQQYQPPPPSPVPPPVDTTSPATLPTRPPNASASTREASKWTRLLTTPVPLVVLTSSATPASQPQSTASSSSPRRNPSRNATRQPLNVSSFKGQSYEKPRSALTLSYLSFSIYQSANC